MGLEIGGGDVALAAVFEAPAGARGVVVVAQAAGGGHAGFGSPVLRMADGLTGARFATLLVDLLGAEADRVTEGVGVDARVLGDRLVAAIDWLALEAVVGDLPPIVRRLPLGCYATGVGAAAAMIAAVRRPDRVAAIVAHDGRPDLGGSALSEVPAATLLLVDGAQPDLVDLNRRAERAMAGQARLDVTSGGGPAEALARAWFERHLPQAAPGDQSS
jgi:hypothetical protein